MNPRLFGTCSPSARSVRGEQTTGYTQPIVNNLLVGNGLYSSPITPGRRYVPPMNYGSTVPFLSPQMPEDTALPGPPRHDISLADWMRLQGIPCNESAVPYPPMQPIYAGSSTPRYNSPARPREDTVPGITHTNVQSGPLDDANEHGHLIKHFNPGPFQCLWHGCTHGRPFLRESTLLRHIRTIHIAPGAYKCPNCNYANGRRDKVLEHVRLVHKR